MISLSIERISNRIKKLRRKYLFNELLFSLILSVFSLIFFTFLILFAFLSPVILLIPFIFFGFQIITKGFLIKRLEIKRFAKRIEETFPVLKDRLLTSLELASHLKLRREGYSTDLINAFIENTEKVLMPLPLEKIVSWKKTRYALVILFATLALWFIGFIGFSERMRLGFYKGFFQDGLPVEFLVSPGNIKVAQGTEVELTAKLVSPYQLKGVNLIVNTKAKESNPKGLPYIGYGVAKTKKIRLKVVAKVKEYSFEANYKFLAEEDFNYYFEVFGKRSQVFNIQVLKPFSIKNLTFTYKFPNYTRLKPLTTFAQEIRALPLTRVLIQGEAENFLSDGKIVLRKEMDSLRPSQALPVEIQGNKFSQEFVVRNEDSLEVILTDSSGNRNQKTVFPIRLIPDEFPFVKIFVPGRDIDLPSSMKLLLGINSLDDYGLTDLALFYEKETTKNRIYLKSFSSYKTEDTTYYYWDLSGAGLAPGDVVKYYVLVRDNDQFFNKKPAASEVFSIRFPSLAEIYERTTQLTSATSERLRPLSQEQEKISEEVSRITEELKKSRKLEWEEQKALQNVAFTQEKLIEKLEELHQEIKLAEDELFQGLTFDKETLERLKELEGLLKEILPEKLKEALEKLQTGLQNKTQNLKEILEKLKLSQEELKKSLDRALELLKNLLEEERLKSLANKAEELFKLQKNLEEKLPTKDLKRPIEEEERVLKGLKELKENTRNLSEQMSDKATKEALEKLGEEMEKMMEKAAKALEDLKMGNPQSAKNRRLSKDLESLKNTLSALLQQLKERRSSEVASKLTSYARDLLTLSFEQENLESELKKISGAKAKRFIGKEKKLEEATKIVAESLVSITKKSLKIPPKLVEPLIKSMRMMAQAAQELEENRLSQSQRTMAEARQGLDETTERILALLNMAQKQGGLSGGLESLLEGLSQLIGEQMGLGQELGGMIPIPVGSGLTPEQLAQLSRMLSKQQAIREALEKMLNEMGGQKPGLTGSLEGVIEEMKRIEKDLRELNVSRELIQRQERITSRLLDAMRSIRRKEFGEKREREIGKDYPIKERPVLPKDLGERRAKLREELLRSLKEDYPKEYETLIRNYFQNLLFEESQ